MSARQEFTKKVRLQAWERCGGRCQCGCGQRILSPEYDHYPVPAALGGSSTLDNCRVLEKRCHRTITAETDVPAIAKAVRGYEKRIGARTKRGRPMPGTRASGWRIRMDGTRERR